MNIETMIELLNKDLQNEWMHLRFYLYHASAVVGLHCEEYKETFLKEAASEMEHVTQFSDVIRGLGGQSTYLSNEFKRHTNPVDIIRCALAMEEEVVSNYTNRIKDAQDLGGTDGQWLEIFLENQIEKSREDVDHYKQILRGI
jgi:bacterioferritin